MARKSRKSRKSRRSRSRRSTRRVTRRSRRSTRRASRRGHTAQNRKFGAAAKKCEKKLAHNFSFKKLGSCMRSEMK